jgi:hypothetical protein
MVKITLISLPSSSVTPGLDAARVRLFQVIQDDLCHAGSVTSP